jgi:hypothetical protein
MKQTNPSWAARAALVHGHGLEAELAEDLQVEQLFAPSSVAPSRLRSVVCGMNGNGVGPKRMPEVARRL